MSCGTDPCLKEIKEDLFNCPSHFSLAHCVSVDLRMGKGIATLFKTKFGNVEELKKQNKQIGDVAILNDAESSRYVYYLVTKQNYFNKPTYKSLQSSLEAMLKHAQENNVTQIAMPRIGCGLDGLTWLKVREIIINVFKQSGIKIEIYSI